MAAKMRYRVKGTKLYVQPHQPRSSLYDAAGQGRRARGWGMSSAGPNASLDFALDTLRRRSREAARQQPYADGAIEAIVTNTIGTGIKPQFTTPDHGLNRELGELWLEWTDESDADGGLDFYGQQALAVRSMVEGGECFGRLRMRRPGDMNSVPLQIQVLEAEYCRSDITMETPEGEARMGVVFDAIGRRVGYRMYRQHPNDWTALGRQANDLQDIFVPASEVAHLRQIRRPGQIRGEPWLTRALVKLRDLDQYDDAQLMRQKIAAMFAGFVTRPGGEGEDEFMGEGAPDGAGVAIAGLEPGTLQFLEPGEEIEFSKPPELQAYEEFMRQQLRGVATAAGVLYELLTGDYSKVNDRTYRASVNEFRRRAAMWQHHLVVFQFCRAVHARWMTAGVLVGAIRPPAGMTVRDLMRVKWVPQGWAYIHPVQEVDAAIKAIGGGLKSRAEAVSETGYDAQQIDQEQAEDNARADRLGLAYTSDGRQGAGGSSSQAADEDEGDGDDE